MFTMKNYVQATSLEEAYALKQKSKKILLTKNLERVILCEVNVLIIKIFEYQSI